MVIIYYTNTNIIVLSIALLTLTCKCLWSATIYPLDLTESCSWGLVICIGEKMREREKRERGRHAYLEGHTIIGNYE